MKLPEELKTVFWNYDTTFMDTNRMKKIIILETLARGSLEQIKILFHLYGYKTVASIFREDVKGPRTLPAPAVYLWSDIFLTDDEFEEYKQWHRHPINKWKQRRAIPWTQR